MIQQAIPKTDLKVSPLCLGTMTFGTPVGEADAIQLTIGIGARRQFYGYRQHVRRLQKVSRVCWRRGRGNFGKALKGKREKAVLATKVGMKIGPADDDQGASRGHILREIDRSLGRLGCDYVDLYYMHKFDPSVPLAESALAFDDLINAGKIRYWAISNFSTEQISNLLKVCDENGWRRPVAFNPPTVCSSATSKPRYCRSASVNRLRCCPIRYFKVAC